jgi:hypothetical protein
MMLTGSRRRSVLLALVAAVGLLAIVLSKGCSSPQPNRNPTGEVFPTVLGQSLEKVPMPLPETLAGQPAVLLIGYTQGAQFDIDRWLMGLMQSGVDARLIEVPTIPGLLPSFASGWIDDGMRSGIPPEDWGAVVTLYGKAAAPVATFTGTERGRLARILVLDSSGTVVWFDDSGYAPRKALDIADLVARLREG